MYAIVEIAGQQFKVEKDQQIFVHRLDAEEGSKVDFDKVLLVDNGGKVNVGAPAVEGAKVTVKVLSHLKGDKVLVFKKKKRIPKVERSQTVVHANSNRINFG